MEQLLCLITETSCSLSTGPAVMGYYRATGCTVQHENMKREHILFITDTAENCLTETHKEPYI